jgi:hypothetical protein
LTEVLIELESGGCRRLAGASTGLISSYNFSLQFLVTISRFDKARGWFGEVKLNTKLRLTRLSGKVEDAKVIWGHDKKIAI